MKEVIELFNVVVVEEYQTLSKGKYNTSYIDEGFILDFNPSVEDLAAIRAVHKPIDVRTLFTVQERKTAPIEYLLMKQFLNYVETYGLDQPGLFNLEVSEGKKINLRLIRGVCKDELEELIIDLLYSNRPVKDVEPIVKIIEEFSIKYDINFVANNELRIRLFDPFVHQFDNGDDVVRYMVYVTTGNTMLIKSREVLQAVSANNRKVTAGLIDKHSTQIAQVFNRHKAIILSAKGSHNRTAINKVSRLSKTAHVALQEPVSKTFINKALTLGRYWDAKKVLEDISLRDKLKFLNVLEMKRKLPHAGVYVIRNGKVFVIEKDSVPFKTSDINMVMHKVLSSIKIDLAYLSNKNILLDPRVHYGLPTSRKQVLGNLPFGTEVYVTDSKISSGVYWENEWGARDLDLSTIDVKGNRTGWGSHFGYSRGNLITYSGDLTDASSGAMEFMTSKGEEYGLYLNIFSGDTDCGYELVVGTEGKKHWINDIIVREKDTLGSRNCVLGFVRDNKFVVFKTRAGQSRVSKFGGTTNYLIERGMVDFWTINKLLDAIGVQYDVDFDPNTNYDHDLSYEGFSLDKLENLLKI